MGLFNLLSTNEIIAQALAFLLLLGILKAAFWKRMLALLDDRNARIASDIEKAEAQRAQAERIRQDYEKALAGIDEAARLRMQDAIGEGRRIADEIRANAARNAETLVENAKITIAAETAKAKDELKKDMVDLVIDVAGKVVQEKLSVEEDRKLVEFFLKESEKGR